MVDHTLKISRHLTAPRATVWRCWVESDLLKQWYCPKPWRVSVAEIDLRAGGASFIVMNGPNGEENQIRGQYLAVEPGRALVFSDAFVGDWMPGDHTPFMTGYVILSDAPDGGTLLEWGARHWTEETKAQHEAMGFEAGWNAAADQLNALAASL